MLFEDSFPWEIVTRKLKHRQMIWMMSLEWPAWQKNYFIYFLFKCYDIVLFVYLH